MARLPKSGPMWKRYGFESQEAYSAWAARQWAQLDAKPPRVAPGDWHARNVVPLRGGKG